MVAKQLVSNNTPSTTSSPVLFSLAGSEDDVATNITTSNSETATKNKSGESFVRSFRLRIVLLIGFILFSTTTMRMNLGMAIVCMVNGSAFSGEEIMVNYNDTGNSDLRCRQLSSPYGDEADEGLGYQVCFFFLVKVEITSKWNF